MVPSTDLFVLIHSLDKNEKRYFRLFAARQAGEKNYLKLFNAISLQEEYDEADIIKQFKKEGFTRRFALTKSYLYGLVLKSLRMYHENRSISLEIKSSLNSINILFSKGLFKQAMKMLMSVKKVVEKYEKIDFKPEIITLQRGIVSALGWQNYTQEDIDNMHGELKKDLGRISTVNDYERLANKLFQTLFNQGFVRDKKQQQELEKIMNDPLLKDESKLPTLGSKLPFYLVHSAYYSMQGDLNKQHYYNEKQVEFYRQYPHMVRDNHKRFLSSLHNYISTCTRLKKYKEAERSILELKNLLSVPEFAKDMLLRVRVFDYSFNVEIDMFIQRGHFDKGIGLVPDFEAGMKQYWKMIKPDSVLMVYFNIAYLYFGAQQYEESKRWINKFFTIPSLYSKKDFYCIARILNLLIHYELGNFDLLEYTLKSTYQLLGRHAKLFRSEKLTLNFIKKYLNSHPDKSTLKKMFQEMIDDIKEIKKDPYEKQLMEYFDLISWVESKIQGRTFGDVIRKKVRAGH